MSWWNFLQYLDKSDSSKYGQWENGKDDKSSKSSYSPSPCAFLWKFFLSLSTKFFFCHFNLPGWFATHSVSCPLSSSIHSAPTLISVSVSLNLSSIETLVICRTLIWLPVPVDPAHRDQLWQLRQKSLSLSSASYFFLVMTKMTIVAIYWELKCLL